MNFEGFYYFIVKVNETEFNIINLTWTIFSFFLIFFSLPFPVKIAVFHFFFCFPEIFIAIFAKIKEEKKTENWTRENWTGLKFILE